MAIREIPIGDSTDYAFECEDCQWLSLPLATREFAIWQGERHRCREKPKEE